MTKQELQDTKRVCGKRFSESDVPTFIRNRENLKEEAEREQSETAYEEEEVDDSIRIASQEPDDYKYQKEREEALIR